MTFNEFAEINVQKKTKQDLIDLLYEAVRDCDFERNRANNLVQYKDILYKNGLLLEDISSNEQILVFKKDRMAVSIIRDLYEYYKKELKEAKEKIRQLELNLL